MKSYEGQAPTDIEDQVESDRTHHVEGGKSIPVLEPYKDLYLKENKILAAVPQNRYHTAAIRLI